MTDHPDPAPESTVAAVRDYLAARRSDPAHHGADLVAAAAALKLAAVLDECKNGSSAANLSRELRQSLEMLRLTELDPPPGADEVKARRVADAAQAEWDRITAELGIGPAVGPVPPPDPDDPPAPAGPVQAF